MSKNRKKRRIPRHKKTVNQVQKTQPSVSIQASSDEEKSTRGKGKRPARIHRSIRLDANMADGIAELSSRWSRSESEVIRELIGAGLNLALNPNAFRR